MKKKLVIALTLVMLVAFAIPAAFATVSDEQESEIENLYTQITELRKEIVQKYVDAGEITPEEGELMQERMDQNNEYRNSQGFERRGGRGNGGGSGFGGGCSAGQGFGPGYNADATADQL